jgi:hypothetical protein
VLVVAWLFGMAARRLKQPAAVGEVTAGVVLAVLATAAGGQLPWLHGVLDSAALAMVAEAGIFLIVLLAGIEMRPAEITENSKDAFFVALGGAALPLVAGVVFGYWVLPESPLRDPQALLLGVAMAVTAIPTTVKVLGELKLLHTRVGRIVVSAAIYDDVIGLMLLAGLTAIIETGEVPDLLSIVWLVAKIAVFFAITVALGVHVYPHVRRRLKALQVASIEFSILMVVGLGYAVLAELLGMHWIMGAFMAGLFFEAPRVGALAYNEMRLLLTGVVGGFLGCRPAGAPGRPTGARGRRRRRRHERTRCRRAGRAFGRLRGRPVPAAGRRPRRGASVLGAGDHGRGHHAAVAAAAAPGDQVAQFSRSVARLGQPMRVCAALAPAKGSTPCLSTMPPRCR